MVTQHCQGGKRAREREDSVTASFTAVPIRTVSLRLHAASQQAALPFEASDSRADESRAFPVT